MEYLQAILSIILIYLGLVIGLIVGYVSKKEVFGGKSYFLFIQKLFISIGVLFTLSLLNIWIGIIGALVIFAIQWIKAKTPFWTYYALWSVLIGITFTFSEVNFTIVASLAFLYSFPTASLYLSTLKKVQKWNEFANHSKIMLTKYWWFPVLSIILVFLIPLTQ